MNDKMELNKNNLKRNSFELFQKENRNIYQKYNIKENGETIIKKKK
jgi:hypothetical protein